MTPEPIDWTPPAEAVKASAHRRSNRDDVRRREEATERLNQDLHARLHRIRDQARLMAGSPTWEVHKAGQVIEQLALGYHGEKARSDMSERILTVQAIGQGTRRPDAPTRLSAESVMRLLGCSRREAEEFLNAPTG